VPVRELTSTANAHSCRFDLLAADPPAAARAFFERLAADRTWDVLRIRDVPEGGAAWALQAEFERAGFPVGAWPSLQSPYVPLPPSWDALAATLDAKFKANVRRRRRKLSERGEVAFERLDGGDGLQQALEVGFSLEAAGWKGERGTAIAQSPETRGFYGELARWAAREQALALLFLRVGGRPVAFHFGLQTPGRYFLLKPGYDPAFRECSPGQLLMEEAIKDCIGRRVNELDFLGPQMEWKRDWTPKVRPHAWLYVFRNNAFGRALRGAKFGLLPRAKKAVARWRH
jgi:CelD/BcsL family acetyltransferase involved in cellulose biosynthesis